MVRPLTDLPIRLRVALALIATIAICLTVWRLAFPEATVLTVILVTTGALGVLLLALLAGLFGASVNQFILRKGGTDQQWLIFPSDPPGLQRPDGSSQKHENSKPDEA